MYMCNSARVCVMICYVFYICDDDSIYFLVAFYIRARVGRDANTRENCYENSPSGNTLKARE